MKLEFNNGLFNSVPVDATRLVLKDNFGQPLLVAIEHDPQTIAVYKAQPGDNEQFKRVLQQLGLQQTNDVREITV